MKTTFVLDVQKTKAEYTSLIVTGRMGDLESNSIDVYIKNDGEPYPLTNLTVFYECLKPDHTVIRDTKGVKMIDAAKGHFTYTFPTEVFSAPGQIKRSFFSIEKDKTFRATTQDFLVISLHDALTGHIESETYISEFDKALEMVKGHRKEIDEANKRIAELTPYIQKKVDETDTKFKGVVGQIQLRLDGVSKQIDAMDVVKKSGDKMSGILTIDYGGNDAPLVLGNLLGKMRFLPHSNGFNYIQSGTVDGKAKSLFITGYNGSLIDEVEVKSKELIVEGIVKQGTDTNWTNLKTTGVETVPDRPLKYKKTGGLVTVLGSIRNPKNTTIFATLPEGFHPPQDVAFPVVVVTGSTTAGEFTNQKGGGLFVNGVPANATCHLVASYVV
ncbi:hypothetical protein COC69_01950 [Bacillus cereus]|uniref:BppU N-terminal domain-containing protein n=1 Tax=Bacillus cereus TaxID=1396 RepID=A0A9X7CS43_BACCE|nr:BppU family phage baseplate upper protein [Bacillus cereus]PGS83542.1 hypothetical protein COC69_01950 [Bacillus cereus]